MNETTTLYQVTLAGAGMFISCFLYSLGGQINKAIRRYGASFILSLTVNLISLWRGIWNPLMLITFPILIGGFSLGYGANDTYHQVIKRTSCALAICMSGLLMAFILKGKAWFIFIPHVGIGAWSIYLGTRSVIEARAEEFFICLLLSMGLMMYPFFGH